MERILVSRQPIYGADLKRLGYELLFRDSEADVASFSDGDQATVEVIVNTFMDIGLDVMVGSDLAFINFDRNLVLGDYCECLPPKRVVLEMLGTVAVDEPLIRKLRELRTSGYRIAVDESSGMEPHSQLLEVADFIKFDMETNDWRSITRSVEQLKQSPVQLIAEKVEHRGQFERCKEIGFDYFQGYFFSRPQVVEGRRVPVSQLATIRLITKLNNPNLEVRDVAKTIGQDVSLSFKLLRHINSAAFTLPVLIGSIQQAVLLMGRERVQTWARLMLFSTLQSRSDEAARTGAIRARMCELLAEASGMPEPERAFLTGLFSVLDVMLERPMEEILASLPLAPDIENALLRRQGDLGRILRGVSEYERRNWQAANAAIDLNESLIQDAYRKAVAWSLTTLTGLAPTDQPIRKLAR